MQDLIDARQKARADKDFAKADEIIISWEGNEKKVNALVGISDGELKNSEYKAIFNPKLLN
mgnify:CR=1 FL=1